MRLSRKNTLIRIRNLMIFGFAALLIVIAVGVAALARSRAHSLVYPPRIPVTASPEEVGLRGAAAVRFTTADGIPLEGWYIPPRAEAAGAVVVLVHGLAANRTALLDQARLAVDAGYGALLFDLRNHGSSGGSQTTLGYSEPEDVLAAVAFLQARDEVDPTRIVLVGESLGGASVLRAAARLPDIAGVVAQAAYSSIEDNIAEGVQRITGLPAFPFAPLIILFGERETGARIAAVRPIDDVVRIAPRPILFMHGDRDGLVDVGNSQRMAAAAGANAELIVFPGAWHGGLHLQDPQLFAPAFMAFLARVVPLRQPA
jgi:dipeptidyl aminopeptidase/acylaminoacyl peptidase